jgi:hypothetical protein
MRISCKVLVPYSTKPALTWRPCKQVKLYQIPKCVKNSLRPKHIGTKVIIVVVAMSANGRYMMVTPVVQHLDPACGVLEHS